jgi:hypothetical protein
MDPPALITAETHRHWFLTWTTYGTWLPGDERGFVSNVRFGPGPELRHNQITEAYDANMPGLIKSSKANLTGPVIWLRKAHADHLLSQFLETARIRKWFPRTIAIMVNHVHIVTAVTGDPEPEDVLRDFKSYGSRKLNQHFGKPESDTWWTESGSKRKLRDNKAIANANLYVKNQENPLLVWVDPDVEAALKIEH